MLMSKKKGKNEKGERMQGNCHRENGKKKPISMTYLLLQVCVLCLRDIKDNRTIRVRKKSKELWKGRKGIRT